MEPDKLGYVLVGALDDAAGGETATAAATLLALACESAVEDADDHGLTAAECDWLRRLGARCRERRNVGQSVIRLYDERRSRETAD